MKIEKALLVVSLAILLFIPIWICAAVPETKAISAGYTDVSEFLGKAEWTDPGKEPVTLAIREVFSNKVMAVQGDTATIEMTSLAEDLITGERFWNSVDTVSANRKSGKLEDGSYLFFQPHSEKKNVERVKLYSYLPVTTIYFEREELVQGLETYVFSYDVTNTDVSANYPLWAAEGEGALSHDSGLVWVEPVSGHIVRAEANWTISLKSDSTKNIDVGNIWYSDDTIYAHVRRAQNEKRTIELGEILFPVLLGIIALAFMTAVAIARPKTAKARRRRKG